MAMRFIGLILDNVVQMKIMGPNSDDAPCGETLQALWTYIINSLACIFIGFILCCCQCCNTDGETDAYTGLYLPVMALWSLLRIVGAVVAMSFGLLACGIGLAIGSEIIAAILVITVPFEAMSEALCGVGE
jgi:hypothetical protein